jgi:hypothetical protein
MLCNLCPFVVLVTASVLSRTLWKAKSMREPMVQVTGNFVFNEHVDERSGGSGSVCTAYQLYDLTIHIYCNLICRSKAEACVPKLRHKMYSHISVWTHWPLSLKFDIGCLSSTVRLLKSQLLLAWSLDWRAPDGTDGNIQLESELGGMVVTMRASSTLRIQI